MSIFNPSRGTGVFGKSVENMGFPYSTQATPIYSGSPVNVSNRTLSPQQQNSSAMRSSSSSARSPQRVSAGTVNAGRTGQTVSRTETSASRTPSSRGQTSSSTQQTSTQQNSTPKKGIAIENKAWSSPSSTVAVVKSTGQVYQNNYYYFPNVSDTDLAHMKSVVRWDLFSKLVSNVTVKMPNVRNRGQLNDVKISFFDALGLDLTEPKVDTETRRVYASVGLTTSEQHDIPLAVIGLLSSVLRESEWSTRSPRNRQGLLGQAEAVRFNKLAYLGTVTKQIKYLKSKRSEILQAMFQLFMDAHFPSYVASVYTRRDTTRFMHEGGITIQPFTDSVAESARRSLYGIWGDCFQAPQQMSGVGSPIFSKSRAQVSGGKAILNSGGQNAFPLGDFLSTIASSGYMMPNSRVDGFGANFYSQNPQAAKLNFSKIYKATTSRRGFMKTLGLFVNASTMVKAYPQEIGTGNLAYRVARAQYTHSSTGSEALRYFLSTGKDKPRVSTSLKKQAPELGSRKTSMRYVEMSTLFSTLFLIDFMSCKDRKIVRSSPRTYVVLGNNHFGDHVKNFLNWIPQRAAFVINQASRVLTDKAPRLPSGSILPRMPVLPTRGSSTTSRRPIPSKGGKTKVGLTPVRSGKSMSPFRSITAALARKQGKPTKSSPSRKFGIASMVDIHRQSRPSLDPRTKRTSAPTPATVSDVVRILSEPNIKRIVQHIEIPLDPNVVLEFGKRVLGRPVMRNFVDDVVLGIIAFWIAYPQLTKSITQMLENSQKLAGIARSDAEFSALSNGLEDMFGLDDPEFTQSLMQLPRRSVVPFRDDVILTDVELPSDDPSFDEVAVDVVVDQNTGDAVAVPVEDITSPISETFDMDVVPPQIQPSIPDIDAMPTDLIQPLPTDSIPAVEPPSGGGSVVAADKVKKPNDVKESQSSDTEEEKTSYTPWIVGGVATVVVGAGVFMYMNKKKQSL